MIIAPSEALADPLTITETRITTSGSANNPDIHEGKIAWEDAHNGGNPNIYMYDLSTKKETKITTDETNRNPAIYSNKIAYTWVSTTEPDSLIKMYDLSIQKETTIGQFTSGYMHPAIYGNRIVWDENYILMYDLSTNTETQISSRDYAYNPAIYKDNIVWEDKSGNISIYDLSAKKETKITTSGSAFYPRIYGDKIVWEDHRRGVYSDIYMYDLSIQKETLITNNRSAPAIFEDKIVWTNGNIYMYDLSTNAETQITKSGSASKPRIYGDTIVWQDSRNGGSDIYMATLISSNPPVADFSASPLSGNAPLKVQFTDNSTGFPTLWNWDFGDGNTSIEQSPEHTYNTAGNFTVNLTVSNANGTSSKTATIAVSEKPASELPVVNFTTNVSEGYSPLSIQFTDLSENAAFISWDFGDGANSTEKNPIHTYSIAGIYTVNLTASNANGSDFKLATVTVLEKIAPVLPVANFTTNVSEGYVPLSVQFTDLSENATSHNWDFGDGASSTEQNPIHTYSAAGNYTVNMTVINANGTASTSSIIIIRNQPVVLPIADFKSDVTTGFTPLTVQFTDLSKYAAGWNWDFGDGISSTEQNPMHTYRSVGNYSVTLTVNNEAGTDTETKANYINAKPVSSKLIAAFYAFPTSGDAPLKVAFTDKSTGSPIWWKWSFGDGTYSTAKNPVHTYSKAGKYTVSLIVKNSQGSSQVTKSKYIKVVTKIKAPVAIFSASPTSGNAPLKVAFTDRSKGHPTSWKWSFGDGTYSTDKNPVHTYSKAGKYTINLTVKNAVGKSTVTGFGYIKVAPLLKSPIAAFTASPTIGKAPLTVRFKDKSTGSPTSWYWNFGDGSTSKVQNPIHTYKVGGNKKYYTVSLTVKNASGYNTKKIYNYIGVSK